MILIQNLPNLGEQTIIVYLHTGKLQNHPAIEVTQVKKPQITLQIQ